MGRTNILESFVEASLASEGCKEIILSFLLKFKEPGLTVQSIVSLTKSLRCQLVNYMFMLTT